MSKIPVYKTETQALVAAKNEALHSLGLTIDQTANDQWLVKDASCQCNCGETAAIHVIFFDTQNNQHYGKAGVCEDCGE